MPRRPKNWVKKPSRKPPDKESQQLQEDRRRERLPKTIAMYLKGVRCDEIATATGCQPEDIYHDLERMREIWRERSQTEAAAALAEQLARVDLCEHEAWKGWEDSRKSLVERGTEKDADDKLLKKTTKRRTTSGAARFLEIVLQCVDRRVKLLRLDAEKTASEELAEVVEIVVHTREQAGTIMHYEAFARGRIEAAAQVLEQSGTVIEQG